MRAQTVLVPLLLSASLISATHGEVRGAVSTIGVNGRANAYASVAVQRRFAAIAWGATTPEGITDVYVTVSRDGGSTFSAPTRVNNLADRATLSGEQPPRIALIEHAGHDPIVTVVWTARNSSGTRLLSSRSADGGRTFAAAISVPGSDAPGNRGWEAIAAGADGSVDAVWLDHRELSTSTSMNHAEHRHLETGQNKAEGVARAQLSKLFFARLDRPDTAHAIASGVCYCCKTSIATASTGEVYAAWRHVYEGNIRDIAFSKSSDGGRTFSAPVRVSDDHWVLDGCPENGPALVADSRKRVHVVWPTLLPGADSTPTLGLFYAMSNDGIHFTPRQPLPTEGIPRHVQLAVGPHDDVTAVWDEQAGMRRIALARVKIDSTGATRFVREPIADAGPAVFPAIAASDGGMIVAWTSGTTGATMLHVERMTGFALRVAAAVGGLAALALVGFPSAAAQAPQQQQPQPPQPPIFRAGANVVRVDVTVTKRTGEPATDLTRDDFALTEDGAPQTIDSFELVRATGEPTDDRTLEIYSQSQAATEAARDDVRLFLIFWDEYHIDQFIPAQRAREALTEFVRTAFGPTDLVAIMDQLTTIDSVRFTRDRIELANQVHALKGRLGIYAPPRSAVEEAHLQFPREIARLRNDVTASALNAAAAFLGNFREGRKALLFVSQGILYGRSGENDRYLQIVRTANTNNTAIYTFDPASEVGRRPESLLSLAYDTGGRPIVGTNRPGQLLPQIVRDASAYYLLGYRSPAPVDGKFHRIKVRLNKGGYEVRARSGYFAPSVGELERARADAAAAELPDDIERALGELSMTGRSERRTDNWIGMARGNDGRTRVTIVWAPRAAGSTGGTVSMSINATSPDGTSYLAASHTTEREVTFEAPAGDVVLATTAFDAQGNEIDGDMRRVTVPALDGSMLAIGTPAVFRTRTARDVRAVIDGVGVRPEVGREFDRPDRLFIRVPVYGGTDVAATARLLNQKGGDMRTLPVTAVGEALYQLDLPLGTTAHGDYVIAIEASRGAESVRMLVPIRVR